MLSALFSKRTRNHMVGDYTYSAAFVINEKPRYVSACLIDNARRIFLDGKLFYSELLQDFINDDRSLPVVIPTFEEINVKVDSTKPIPKQNNY